MASPYFITFFEVKHMFFYFKKAKVTIYIPCAKYTAVKS